MDFPYGTEVVTYKNVAGLQFAVEILVEHGHSFIVHPKTHQIAMSEAAWEDLEEYN